MAWIRPVGHLLLLPYTGRRKGSRSHVRTPAAARVWSHPQSPVGAGVPLPRSSIPPTVLSVARPHGAAYQPPCPTPAGGSSSLLLVRSYLNCLETPGPGTEKPRYSRASRCQAHTRLPTSLSKTTLRISPGLFADSSAVICIRRATCWRSDSG